MVNENVLFFELHFADNIADDIMPLCEVIICSTYPTNSDSFLCYGTCQVAVAVPVLLGKYD